MNKTNNSLIKLMSVFGKTGKGSVQLMAEQHNVNINDDKHRNKEEE